MTNAEFVNGLIKHLTVVKISWEEELSRAKKYVYELPDKTKVSYEKGSVMDEMAEDTGRGKHHTNRYLKKRELFDEVYSHKLHMAMKELSKGRFNNARKFGSEFLQLTPTAMMLGATRVKDAASDAIDYGRQFLKRF